MPSIRLAVALSALVWTFPLLSQVAPPRRPSGANPLPDPSIAARESAAKIAAVAKDLKSAKDTIAERIRSFDAERGEAIKAKFTEAELKNADDLRQIAERAEKTGNFDLALRSLREARLSVPYLPENLPPHVTRVLGSQRLQQTGPIQALALDPTGHRCAAAGNDGSVAVWNLDNGRLIRAYKGHANLSLAIAWSPDGKWIASGGEREVHIWDPATGTAKYILKGHKANVCALAFTPDSKRLASAAESPDSSVRIWSVETGNEEGTFVEEKEKRIFQIAFDAKGKLLALVAGEYLKVYAFPAKLDAKPAPPKALLSLNQFPFGTHSLAFAADGASVFTAGHDNANNQVKRTPLPGTGPAGRAVDSGYLAHPRPVKCLAVSPDGKYLATGCGDLAIRVWELPKGTLLRTYQGHAAEISCLAFTPDSRTLVSGSHDQSLRVWDISPTDSHATLTDSTGYIWTCAYSPDGKRFATAGADKHVCVYEADTNALLVRFPAHASAVTAIAFSPDGSQLYTVGGDRLLKSWDLPSGKLAKEYKGHTGPVMALAVAGSGDLLLTGSADKLAIVWKKDEEKPFCILDGLNSTVSAADIAPGNKWLAVGTADGTLRLFKPRADKTYEPAGSAAAHVSGVACLQFHPTLPIVATVGGDRMLRFWSISEKGTQAPLSEVIAHEGAISALAYNRDGTALATAGSDQLVKIWNPQTRVERASLRGSTEWVTAVAFAPNGTALLSGGVDKIGRVWALVSAENRAAAGHRRQVTALVAGKGGLFATGSDDRTVKIWDLKTGRETLSLPVEYRAVTALLLFSDGKRLAVAGNAENDRPLPVQIFDIATKGVAATITDADSVPFLGYDSARNRLLLWSQRQGSGKPITRVEVYDGAIKPIRTLTERELDTSCLNFSPDGERVAIGTKDGLVRVWGIEKEERVTKGDLRASAKRVTDVCFAPDGKRLYTADQLGAVKLWNLEDSKEAKSVQAFDLAARGDDAFTQMLLDPAGKRLATFSSDGEVALWDTEKFEKLRDWTLPTKVNALAFSSDGKSLITGNADSTVFVLELP